MNYIYEKGPCGVFFLGRLDSLNMNDTELTFIGIVKLNIERPSFGNEPLLSQVRKTYESRLVFWQAIPSVCHPLLTHKTKWWKTLFGNKPLLSQVRKTYENGLVIWWALTSVCYPLWNCKNEKRHSPFEVGKLKERGMVFICFMPLIYSPPLNMLSFYICIYRQLSF